MVVNGNEIRIVSNRDPTKLPWKEMVSILRSALTQPVVSCQSLKLGLLCAACMQGSWHASPSGQHIHACGLFSAWYLTLQGCC